MLALERKIVSSLLCYSQNVYISNIEKWLYYEFSSFRISCVQKWINENFTPCNKKKAQTHKQVFFLELVFFSYFGYLNSVKETEKNLVDKKIFLHISDNSKHNKQVKWIQYFGSCDFEFFVIFQFITVRAQPPSCLWQFNRPTIYISESETVFTYSS